jgi:hypothetical protein
LKKQDLVFKNDLFTQKGKIQRLDPASTSIMNAVNPTINKIKANNKDKIESVACNSTISRNSHQVSKTTIMQPSIAKE